MRTVKPEQKVKVRVLRDGKNKDFVVVARPMMVTADLQHAAIPQGGAMGAVMAGPMPHVREFRPSGRGSSVAWSWRASRRSSARISVPTRACWWCRLRENAAFKLEDGDVIQTIDGRKPEDGAHAMRILRSYKSGEKLNLTVLRQRKP